MDELTFDSKTYVSSKRAAQITGYAKDYIGQLCREGRVEARLVGRNWYVLESSIREHRFGSEVKKDDAKNESTTNKDSNERWKAVKYTSEETESLQTFSSDMPVEASDSSLSNFLNETDAVKEMHNAWEDWFSQKNIQKLQKSTKEITQEPSEDAEYASPVQEFVSDDIKSEIELEVRPIWLHKETESFESDEIEAEEPDHEAEIVPIHRTYEPQVSVTPPSLRDNSYRKQPTYAPEGRIIRERSVRQKSRPSLVLSAFFISCAAIAIAVALIGSGKLPQISSVHYFLIQYLQGESTISKK